MQRQLRSAGVLLAIATRLLGEVARFGTRLGRVLGLLWSTAAPLMLLVAVACSPAYAVSSVRLYDRRHDRNRVCRW